MFDGLMKMRLFIALNFSQENKDLLAGITADLAAISLTSRPVHRDNYHLTLAFIGESNAADQLKCCIDAAAGSPFSLVASQLGCFHRQGGDIIWLGIKPEPALFQLQQRLAANLKEAGFVLENRPFRPHLTLLRQAVMPDDFDFRRYTVQMPELRQMIDRISLMKSERIAGKLVYSELYGKDLASGA